MSSRRRSTGQIIKERLSVLAVIIVCLVLVAVVQEARRFFIARQQPATATPAATPTPRDEPQAAPPTVQPATAAASNEPSTPAPVPAKPGNLSGKWAGTFSETVDGSPQQYRYTLELSQQGSFIAGKSTIEKEDDPGAFASFVIRGQIVQDAAGPAVNIAEDLLGAQKLRSGSAVGPRNTQFSYFVTESREYLEGEWVDRRAGAQHITGTVTLTKQP
jgi:hypothetical protein